MTGAKKEQEAVQKPGYVQPCESGKLAHPTLSSIVGEEKNLVRLYMHHQDSAVFYHYATNFSTDQRSTFMVPKMPATCSLANPLLTKQSQNVRNCDPTLNFLNHFCSAVVSGLSLMKTPPPLLDDMQPQTSAPRKRQSCIQFTP